MDNLVIGVRADSWSYVEQDDICPECMGNGTEHKCEVCDGDGWFDHCGEDYDCLTCGGAGRISCQFCGATGTYAGYEVENRHQRVKALMKKRYGKRMPENMSDYWIGSR